MTRYTLIFYLSLVFFSALHLCFPRTLSNSSLSGLVRIPNSLSLWFSCSTISFPPVLIPHSNLPHDNLGRREFPYHSAMLRNDFGFVLGAQSKRINRGGGARGEGGELRAEQIHHRRITVVPPPYHQRTTTASPGSPPAHIFIFRFTTSFHQVRLHHSITSTTSVHLHHVHLHLHQFISILPPAITTIHLHDSWLVPHLFIYTILISNFIFRPRGALWFISRFTKLSFSPVHL